MVFGLIWLGLVDVVGFGWVWLDVACSCAFFFRGRSVFLYLAEDHTQACDTKDPSGLCLDLASALREDVRRPVAAKTPPPGPFKMELGEGDPRDLHFMATHFPFGGEE